MNQFLKVLKFEYAGYLKNKAFIVTTIVFALIIAAVFTAPTVMNLVGSPGSDGNDSVNGSLNNETEKTLIISDKSGVYSVADIETALDGQYKCVSENLTVTEIKAKLENEEFTVALYAETPDKVEIYMKSDSLGGAIGYTIGSVVESIYKMYKMQEYGLSVEQAAEILTPLDIKTVETGTGAFTGYILSYVMVMALYITIVLYGQLVAMSVASEKSSRAMELLVTSAKPLNLLFGKVIGAGLSGLTQIFIMIAAGVVFFNINKQSYGEDHVILSLADSFGGPIVYMLIFYILGFFIYAFLYGAFGSLASRVEDINTSVAPLTVLLVIGIFVSIPGMIGSNTGIVTAASFIPLFTPMAMFARICTDSAELWEIMLSILLTAGTTFFIGYISSKIYRMGILMYGNPPKIKELIKLLRQQKKY